MHSFNFNFLFCISELERKSLGVKSKGKGGAHIMEKKVLRNVLIFYCS